MTTQTAVRGWRRLRKLERHEIAWLVVGACVCLLLWGFLSLADEVMEGDTTTVDTRILLAFRKADDPSRPIGPQWVENSLLDVTALGGPTVLGLVVVSVAGFLLLQTRYHTALVVLATAASGEIANMAMKNLFLRPRPTIVPHLRDVSSTSFPSGHAMESAIIYLTLGAMLMRLAERRITKIYCIGIAVFMTLLVGISRVYLGVHYPTDVVAGWMFGFFWASLCWIVARRFEKESGVAEERGKAE
ncbi:MAG TPA: phosphatase PAP2 family protein [Vicinamibacterales bacterium]|nr:phosphatase PAP2 family protein [Vicinamibacterales bacterium]